MAESASDQATVAISAAGVTPLSIDTVAAIASVNTGQRSALQDSDRAIVFIRRAIDSVVTAVPAAPIWLLIVALGLGVLGARALRKPRH